MSPPEVRESPKLSIPGILFFLDHPTDLIIEVSLPESPIWVSSFLHADRIEEPTLEEEEAHSVGGGT